MCISKMKCHDVIEVYFSISHWYIIKQGILLKNVNSDSGVLEWRQIITSRPNPLVHEPKFHIE